MYDTTLIVLLWRYIFDLWWYYKIRHDVKTRVSRNRDVKLGVCRNETKEEEIETRRQISARIKNS